MQSYIKKSSENQIFTGKMEREQSQDRETQTTLSGKKKYRNVQLLCTANANIS